MEGSFLPQIKFFFHFPNLPNWDHIICYIFLPLHGEIKQKKIVLQSLVSVAAFVICFRRLLGLKQCSQSVQQAGMKQTD